MIQVIIAIGLIWFLIVMYQNNKKNKKLYEIDKKREHVKIESEVLDKEKHLAQEIEELKSKKKEIIDIECNSNELTEKG